jgi:formylglycine-generating enzyme required for sulfatase activity
LWIAIILLEARDWGFLMLRTIPYILLVAAIIAESIKSGQFKRKPIKKSLFKMAYSFIGIVVIYGVYIGVNYIIGLTRLDIEVIPVKGGTYTMGCTKSQGDDCDSDEKPNHKVTVYDFYIGKYEVTQRQWEHIMGENPSGHKDCPDCPVENVSWNDVQEYIKKLNAKTGKKYRLPTEAEWEYAAKGGRKMTATKYSGSNNLEDVAWYDDNSSYYATHVGTKAPNELGIYDMSGNVWEWCSDWYGKTYYKHSPKKDPKGPKKGSRRVYRGGSWYYFAAYCRVANRNCSSPTFSDYNFGFRLVIAP